MPHLPGVRATASVSAPPADRAPGAVPGLPTSGGGWAGAPVSAPPVVPAPALPVWPPSTTGAAPSTANDARPTTPTTASPAGRSTAGVTGGRPATGPDLAGTVYGSGEGPGFATIALPANAVETSGSLTGHILAQGWADTPADRPRTTRVLLVLAAALGLLVAVSVLVVLLANNALDGLMGDMLNS
nr:hypothetical protein [Micromonospora sp. ALFpr18c]